MQRYIDVNKIEMKVVAVFDENLDLLVPLSEVRKALQMTPTADVVPRAELDAALADLKRFSDCSACKHYTNSIVKPCAVDGCCVDGKEDKWEWRGIQKEEGVEKHGLDKSD